MRDGGGRRSIIVCICGECGVTGVVVLYDCVCNPLPPLPCICVMPSKCPLAAGRCRSGSARALAWVSLPRQRRHSARWPVAVRNAY